MISGWITENSDNTNHDGESMHGAAGSEPTKGTAVGSMACDDDEGKAWGLEGNTSRKKRKWYCL